MITRENYSIEHIMKLYESSKRDPNLIERVLEVWLDIFIRLTIQQKLHLHMHQLLCIWLHV